MSQDQKAASDAKHLANQFLIAMPGMVDDTFAGTVVYLCDHTDNGAMGLVVNRPTDVDLANVFDKIDLQLEIQPLAKNRFILVALYKPIEALCCMSKKYRWITVLL